MIMVHETRYSYLLEITYFDDYYDVLSWNWETALFRAGIETPSRKIGCHEVEYERTGRYSARCEDSQFERSALTILDITWKWFIEWFIETSRTWRPSRRICLGKSYLARSDNLGKGNWFTYYWISEKTIRRVIGRSCNVIIGFKWPEGSKE